MQDLLQYMELMQLYVLLTFCFALYHSNFRNPNYRLLMLVLTLCVSTEVAANIMLYNRWSLGRFYSFSFFIHQCLWLLLFFKIIGKMKLFWLCFVGYLIFAVVNFLLFEGTVGFNYTTFIVGSFIYLVNFIIESFHQLNRENFDFFTSDEFLLISAPVFFFFGFSFIFGFKSSELSETEVIWNIQLYQLIGAIGNLLYYSIINIYILRTKKIEYAE